MDTFFGFAISKIARLCEEVHELKIWKEAAMRIMPPFQEIGKELGLQVGQDVHDKILPGIQKLKLQLDELRQQVKELEDKLDEARSDIRWLEIMKEEI